MNAVTPHAFASSAALAALRNDIVCAVLSTGEAARDGGVLRQQAHEMTGPMTRRTAPSSARAT